MGVEAPVGLTKDSGWEIGISRTLPLPVEELWQFLLSADARSIWLGPGAALPAEVGAPYRADDGTTGELRSFRPCDRIRFTRRLPGDDHQTTVQVTVQVKESGTALRFHEERMLSPDEREAQRKHWSQVMTMLLELLAR